jgi:putative thioredoxin
MSAKAPWVVDVTEADFEVAVLEASYERPVVVDFWAPWCQPCRLLGPKLEALVGERQGKVVLAKVNTEVAPALAEYFQIAAIPAVKAFRDGQIVREFEGLLSDADLRAFLEGIAGVSDRVADEARALEASRPAEAERRYREALKARPDDVQARLGLARVLLAQDRTEGVEDLLEPVGAEGEAGAEVERLKARLFFARLGRDFPDEVELRRRVAADPKAALPRYELGCVLARRGEHAAALEALLAAAERDFQLAGTKVREAMVKVFYDLGANHPLANEYRTKLARLLY